MVSERSESNQWHLYILECKDKSLYTGITNDLKRRLKEHKSGVSHFTSYNRPTKIIHTEHFSTKFEAAAREKQIKGWTRAKKIALAKGDLALLKRL
jgi:predicted GIY-YIG superfamily endonuclease